jgi:nitroreductase
MTARRNGTASHAVPFREDILYQENILLQADSLGYGAVWLAIAPNEERMANVTNVLHLPDTLKPFCLIPVGVPAEEHVQPNRFDPSRIHEI